MNQNHKNRGYIVVWRDIDTAPWYKDSDCSHLAQHLLRIANYSEQDVLTNGKIRLIKRGQRLIGFKTIEEATGLSRAKYRRCMGILKKCGFIDYETAKGGNFNQEGTIVTICNYNSYQFDMLKPDHCPTIEQPLNNHCPTIEQPQSIRSNNDNNDNNVITTTTPEAVVESKPSKFQKDKERLLGMPLEVPEDLIDLWYEILNTFGVNKPVTLNENIERMEWACANDMLKNCLTDKTGLKTALYEYAAQTCLDGRDKHAYVRKNSFSPIQIGLSNVCKKMIARKIVGYAAPGSKQHQGELTVEDVIAGRHKRCPGELTVEDVISGKY